MCSVLNAILLPVPAWGMMTVPIIHSAHEFLTTALPLLCRWGNGGPERLTSLPRVAQLVRCRAQLGWLQSSGLLATGLSSSERSLFTEHRAGFTGG